MRKWLVRLYPRAWRRRYEAEFLALLEQQALTARDILDIVRGSLDAHWTGSFRNLKEQTMITFTFRMQIRRRTARLVAVILLSYLASYVVCRTVGLIVHQAGSRQHRVVAGSAVELDPLDVMYFPLRTIERASWYLVRPNGL